MGLKDIVNRENVNLQNCDQEPIHIPGTIQPHGFLIAIDKSNQRIKFCSGNSDKYIGLHPADLLNTPAVEIFGEENFALVKKLFDSTPGKISVIKIKLFEKQLDFISHLSGENLILEAEQPHSEILNTDLVDLSREFVTAMEDTQSLKELCNLVAVNIKKITGYDRVMVYHFDKDYNGEVIAEAKNEQLEGFFGLHYPHTDIPVQARELYIRNQLRIIVDMDYVPVPLYTTENVKNDALDLSLSVLRSVSPIHVQYLHNMGVGATLTISLVLRGKLWGLIACHHYSPKYLPYDIRMSAKLLGHFITSQIDSRNLNEEHDVRNKVNQAVEHLGSKKLAFTRASLHEIASDPSLLQICNADGVAITVNDVIYKSGNTPSDSDILALARQLKDRSEYITESISDIFQYKALDSDSLPGLIFYAIPNVSGGCVMWFRKETIHDVHWAGDPAKSIEKDKNGLSPRKSFELWRETVKNQSKIWLASEVNASLNFVNILERHINAIFLAEEEEKQRQLANDLIKTNAELENINYISTHDLQEPLRKIQMTASVLLGNKNEQLPPGAFEKVNKMNQFAGRMQFLIKDILKYTQLNYNTEAFEKVHLKNLLIDLKIELSETLNDKKAILEVSDLPEVNGVPFLIRQLFTNLVNNSLKFSDPGRTPVIKIYGDEDSNAVGDQSAFPSSDYYVICYQDNGVGFESENNEKIFKIFTRLYSSQQVSGSGIGLAICRKIMHTHKGEIFAEGSSGSGAVFRLYFPKALVDENKITTLRE